MEEHNNFESVVQEETSWWERIKGAFFGIIFGGILILIGSLILWNNEQDFVRTQNELIIMKKNTQIFSTGSSQTGLVLVSEMLSTNEILKNSLFGVTTSGALSLKMNVETYQWIEKKTTNTSKNLGGSQTTTTRYSYIKDWSSDYHDATTFHSSGMYNPPVKYENSQLFSQEPRMGALEISQEFLNNIPSSNYVPLEIPQSIIKRGQLLLNQKITSVQSGSLYIGTGSYASPNIGDSLIHFSYLPSNQYTLIGVKNNNIITPYLDDSGSQIIPIEKGIQSLEHMYKTLNDINNFTTWLLRGVGLLLIFIGFTLIFNLVVVLADFIPFFGSIINFGTNLISFFLTCILGGTIILLAWFYARPWYSAIFLGVIFLIFYFLKRKKEYGPFS